MIAVIIPLKDIVIDPDNPVDLRALSEDEAIQLIKQTYSFMSAEITVTIKDRIATIILPDIEGKQTEQALQWYETAVASARRGDYARAISLFKRVLEVLPNHVDARRNLAMAYLESGDKETALNHLIEVLRLDPNNVWGYVLLGNIYSKYEQDYDKAEKWYRKAFELNPKDAVLLTNYGALMTRRGDHEQAVEFFERAIEANKTFPNAYFALASLDEQDGKTERALSDLDRLFDNSEASDVRNSTLYAEARKLYLQVNRKLAEQKHDEFMQVIEQRKNELAIQDAGYTIRFVEDPTLKSSAAITETAWNHDRNEHVIRYGLKEPPVIPHLLAHELEHIALAYGARASKHNRLFRATPETRQVVLKAIRDDTLRLRDLGLPDEQFTEYIDSIVDGIANQLFNAPIDMLIEHRLYHNLPEIRPSQFYSLYSFHQDGIAVFTRKEIKQHSPRRIWKANITMNAATALFVDSLYAGRTDYAQVYRSSDVFDTSKRLFALWQEMMEDYQYGDEYELVDQFARILKLEGWYLWRPDVDSVLNAAPTSSSSIPSAPEGASDPDFFKSQKPAMTLFLLNAIERLEKLSDEQVKQIGLEIGMRGAEGINYTSGEQTHTISIFPGETFSGLQLLCLMYVAFQRIDPNVDIGVDFKEAYEMALKMHDARNK